MWGILRGVRRKILRLYLLRTTGVPDVRNSMTENTFHHISVLLQPAVSLLNVRPGQWYIDCTLGSGGHCLEILKQGGNVLGLDRDPEAIARTMARLTEVHMGNYGTYILKHAAFGSLAEVAAAEGITSVAGVLFDLGVSTDQLVNPERGFSFRNAGPLDMRMDTTQEITAESIINSYSEKRLYEIFHFFADERRARQLAEAVVSTRKVKHIATTDELATIAQKVYGGRDRVKGIHPATKMFQAVRMAVNQEAEQIMAALPEAWKLLQPGGRLVVISFHSGEDRLVKHFFGYAVEQLQGKLVTRKPISPTEAEVAANPKSRSAKLRAIEK